MNTIKSKLINSLTFIISIIVVSVVAQEPTLLRQIDVVQYPDKLGVYSNPSLLAKNNGFDLFVGWFDSPSSFIPFSVLKAKVYELDNFTTYAGYSYVFMKNELPQQAGFRPPPLKQNVNSFIIANKLILPNQYVSEVQFGLSVNLFGTDYFDIQRNRYYSVDVGLNSQIYESKKIRILSGVSVQNIYSTKVTSNIYSSELGQEVMVMEIRKYQPYLDYQFGIFILKTIQINGTINIAGEPQKSVTGQKYLRMMGVLNSVTYQMNFLRHLGVNLKLKSDNNAWIGGVVVVPLSNWFDYLHDIELKTDTRFPFVWDKGNTNGLSSIVAISIGFNIP